MYECKYFVMDFETGGFTADKNPITEIAVVLLNHRMEIEDRWSSFVYPYNDLRVDKGALEATNLTMAEIMTGIDQREVYKKMSDWLKKSKCGRFSKPHLVGHNFYKFDMPFLRYLFKLNGDDVDGYIDYIWDTMRMSQLIWSTDSILNYQLATCCKRAGVELVEAHRALPDTEATAGLFKFLRSSSESTVAVQTTPTTKRFRDAFTF